MESLDVIYSNLQTKAIETALYLAKPNTIPLQTHEDLGEVSSFTQKFLRDSYLETVDQFYGSGIERIAGGETVQEALKRFEDTLKEIAKEPFQNIGIVTHGNILAFFSAKYSNYSARELHDKIQMPDAAIFDWDNKQFIKFWGEQ